MLIVYFLYILSDIIGSLGDNFLRVTHISTHLASRDSVILLVPDYFLKNICMAERLGRYTAVFSQERRQIFSVQNNICQVPNLGKFVSTSLKRLWFPVVRFSLLYYKSLSAQTLCGPCHVTMWELGLNNLL